MIKLVVFDLDNVIIDGEAIDEIGKLANVEEEIAEITEKAMKGEIDFETSIKDRVKLLEGTSIEEIQKVTDKLPLMPGAEKTINDLKNENLKIAIISGSFDIVANVIKEKLGIDYIFTNSFVVSDGKLTGEVEGPLVSGTKLEVLNDLLSNEDILLEDVVAVGDGANDISMIQSAGMGIAFNAKDSVKEIADIVIDEKDLTKVLDEIDDQITADVVEETAVEQAIEDNEKESELEQAAKDIESEVEDSQEVNDVLDEVVPEVAAVEESERESEDQAELEQAVKDIEVEQETADEEKEKTTSKGSKSGKNSLPEPTIVLADTIEGVKQQKNEKEAEISKIVEEREVFNKIAKEQRKVRNKLNASLKDNLNKAIEFRNKRNEINKEVEQAKKERNDANNHLKKMEWSSGKREKVKLENEIKKIDKIIETRVLDIKKENQLVKNANDLRKQLMAIKEDESNQGEIQDLKKLSEEQHLKVIELSEKAQEAHEEMLNYFKKTDDIRTAADDAHKKFIEARKNASDKHEAFKAILSDIHVINKKLGSNKPKRRKPETKPSNNKGNKNREEKEKAEKIFEKFKKGGKLTTDELLLLQKYNIA